MSRINFSVCGLIGIWLASSAATAADNSRNALWAAVRNSDVPAIKAALDAGADVNAKNEMGITALWIACGKDKLDVIQTLLDRGADVNARDFIWYQTPLSSALGVKNVEIIKTLLKAGARDIEPAVLNTANGSNVAILQVLLDTGKVRPEVLNAALYAAKNKEIQDALKKAGATELKTYSEAERDTWKPLAGAYESDNGGALIIEVKDVGLIARAGIASGGSVMVPKGDNVFAPIGSSDPAASNTFEIKDGKVSRMIMKRFTAEMIFFRSDAKPAPKVVAATQATDDGGVVATTLNWPGFRGPDSTGVADGQHPPTSWNVKDSVNVRWKTPIPGLGHSCPCIWGDRVFITTAISGDADPKIRTGNYGDVESVNDTSKHTWKTYCLNRDTGEILWERTAFEGVPHTKRHLKGSQANCTPVTDGKRVVVCFGPEGMYCYDLAGKLLWQRDLGNLDSSFSLDKEYEWGFGSSPIIYEGLVILQCDVSKDSFIAAFSLDDGSKVWSTPRDEIPSWSSPTLWKTGDRAEIVTNASQFARGYDPLTGKELWRLAKKSECTIPAPVPGRGKMFIVSGNRPIQPIFALRPGASGDISLKDNESENAHIVWSKMRGGPYMQTPLVYGSHLYICSNAGILTCYDADTGAELYKERIGGVSYTASPVAADGRIYFTSEQGSVRVVKAGPKFELLAVNEMDDVCMATPAISNGALFVRSQHFLWCLGKK